MPNGAHALQLLAPEIPVAPVFAEAPANKPDAASVGSRGAEVATAVASAVTGFCFALFEYQDGGLRSETRTAIAERTARVAMLQLELGDHDFAIHARGARSILRQSLDAEFFQRYTSAQADEAVDIWLGELLAVVDRVVADERAFVLAMTH